MSDSSDYTEARSILGKDFISADQIATARGLTYTEDQLIVLGKSLPEKAMLASLSTAGMFLTAGPPMSMSILDIRALNTDYFYSKGPDKGDSGWYDEASENFSHNDKIETLIWIALRKEPVENSLNKTWSDQQLLVADPMIVPNVAEATWGLTTYKAVHDIYLLDKLYVRTSSLGSISYGVSVGGSGNGGLSVGHSWGNRQVPHLGVLAAQKFRVLNH